MARVHIRPRREQNVDQEVSDYQCGRKSVAGQNAPITRCILYRSSASIRPSADYREVFISNFTWSCGNTATKYFAI